MTADRDALVARLRDVARERLIDFADVVGADMMNQSADTIESLAAENGQLRELMNVYNVGGWTDAETLMKERDEARDTLAKEDSHAVICMAVALHNRGLDQKAWDLLREHLVNVADAALATFGG